MSLPAVIFAIAQTGASANGGITSITHVMKNLRHHRAVIVTNAETEQTKIWRSAGIETHVVPQSASRSLRHDPLGSMASYLRYYRVLSALLNLTNARVLHANDPLMFQLSLAAVKRRTGTKIVMNLRDTLDPDRTPPSLKYRLYFTLADHVFYLSEDMADRWAIIASNAKDRFSVTYSVVDHLRYRPLNPLPSAPPIVLLAGIIRPKKGQLEFLRRVAPRLAAEGVEIRLAGDFDPAANPYDAACFAAAAPLGQSVRFLGYRNDLPELINEATVVVVASRHEGLVRSMIEAMSCARPVVSFDVCSAREVLEELSSNAGIVVHHGDYDSMVEAILSYCRDERKAQEAGLAGHKASRLLFEAECVVKRYENAYRELADPDAP